MARRNSVFRKITDNLMSDGFSNEQAKKLAKDAVRQSRKHGKGRPAGHGNQNDVNPVTIVDDACIGIPVTCNSNSKFRTIDGKCNNLKNEYWGAMSTAFLREIFVGEYDPKANAVYLDEDEKLSGVPSGTYRSLEETNRKGKKGKGGKGGKGGGKGGGNGGGHGGGNGGGNGDGDAQTCSKRGTLPTARYVSSTFHTSENISASAVTHMLTQWGQFLDHDITLTPENEVHDCCTANSEDECFPIFISASDPFYSDKSLNCLEFSRSVAYCEENGGARQQLNGITSFIDASNVYGSDDFTAAALRSFTDGKLKMGANNLLPQTDGIEIAGDVRALEMPGLASMHTLFAREHNRLCNLIKEAEPSWNDETIYQNARRILIAEYQSITYGGYLPAVLGDDNMGSLKLKKSGSNYNAKTNPGMTNEFATASYRFGHSMIQGLIKLFYPDGSGYEGEYFLSENYFNTGTYREYMDSILMGLVTQPAQKFDKEITSETTNLLFPEPGANFGSDLAARNIQRGRDHGLPGFCCYYKLYDDKNHDCSNGWNDRYHDISKENWNLLQTIYEHPNDIDLFTGALAQNSYNGGLTGKVFLTMKSTYLKYSFDIMIILFFLDFREPI